MPITLGILAQARQAAAGATFELLEFTVLGSGQASVEFTNLTTKYASTYQHLQLRIATRTNRSAADSDPVILRFNSDTGTNYARHGLLGYNIGGSSAVISNAAASANSIFLTEAMPVSSSISNAFGAIVTDILDPFETSKNKTVRSLAGMNASWSSIELRSGLWMNTASVTSITIAPLVGTQLVQNSRFSLYGVRSN